MTEKDIVKIAKRENNKKRNYLVVNKLQGKHIPVTPSNAFEMFGKMADLIKCYSEKILIVGFAETATAIGAAIAVEIGCDYIQTTRENVDGAEYLFFSESHSHATEQRLVRNELDKKINEIDRIVFAEDEITTGNTIIHIIDKIEQEYGKKVNFSVVSVLNGMEKEHIDTYKKRNINVHYLIKTDNSRYGDVADKYENSGIYYEKNTGECNAEIINVGGYEDTRRIVDGKKYNAACNGLWDSIKSKYDNVSGKKILVMGTEEFMFPALKIGFFLEMGGNDVKSHSTTRSPIAVCSEKEYPLHERYELESLYEENRKTFVYDIDKYDDVIILTDSVCRKDGVNSLVNALSGKNKKIAIYRWCKEHENG